PGFKPGCCTGSVLSQEERGTLEVQCLSGHPADFESAPAPWLVRAPGLMQSSQYRSENPEDKRNPCRDCDVPPETRPTASMHNRGDLMVHRGVRVCRRVSDRGLPA